MTIKDMLQETLGSEYERTVKEMDLPMMARMWWDNPHQHLVLVKNIKRNKKAQE